MLLIERLICGFTVGSLKTQKINQPEAGAYRLRIRYTGQDCMRIENTQIYPGNYQVAK